MSWNYIFANYGRLFKPKDVFKVFQILLCYIFISFSCIAFGEDKICTYETWDWDSRSRKAINHQKIRKSWKSLSTEERGVTPGCSICAEDQMEVRAPGLPPFTLCKKIALRVRDVLSQAKQNGFPIHSITGYRVGKSKGPLDPSGVRTQFSNHSYGTALDINAELNGLYDDCIQFYPGCRLIRGGPYQSQRAGAIRSDLPLTQNLKKVGLRWGGELYGKQKDFMHFSLNGS